MKISIFIALIVSIALTGCFKGEGQVRIDSDVQNAIIIIDGDKKGMTGDGYTTIILEEGDHKVRIYKEKDEEWFYEGTQNIFVGANSSVKVMIEIDRKPTEFRVERLAKEKKERDIRLTKEKKERKIKLAKEKKERDIRLAKEKKIEDERLAKEKKETWNSIEVFIDRSAGLIWQDNKDAKTVRKNWSDAVNYCETLEFANSKNWRLPMSKELSGLTRQKENLNNCYSHKYWSSSNPTWGNAIWFGHGFPYGNNNHGTNYWVRCVRDVQ